MSSSTCRSSHARAILGPDLHARLPDIRVLLVGAGGIGCELLKNIVLTGFGHITLLDLDTIDLSNLNRQFLFKKKDVKQSKALVAAQTAGAFNPNVHIHPIHGNIKEPHFDILWFQGFDIVLNALDNLDARRHVNKMCMAARIPLVESGTAGYLGQVQPLLKDITECFDCISKPTPKTFPVCTIRSTPSMPIHCIVWAKSYLCGQLFGEDEDAVGELDEAEKQGEDAQEIATLRKEALAFKSVRASLRSSSATEGDAAKAVFQKVFNADIQNLLSMADMWRSRAPPVLLDFDAIQNNNFVLDPSAKATNGFATVSSSNPKPATKSKAKKSALSSPSNKRQTRSSSRLAAASGSKATEKLLNGVPNATPNGVITPPVSEGLKDQRKLSLKDNFELFVASTNRLASRLRAGEETITFDKDDDDTLDFVTASANLRSFAYGIEVKTRWEVKEMAGNIIPAIATTNAIVSGLIVLQALQLLRKSYTTLKNVHLQFKPSVPLSTINLCPPNPNCGVCRDTYASVLCDPSRVTLGEMVSGILGGEEGKREVSVYEDKRVLSDPDWEDNWERTLESLNVTRGKFLTIVDDEGDWGTIAVGLGVLPANHPIDAPPIIFPNPLPKPPQKMKPPMPSTPPPTLKRPAPDDDILAFEPSSKKSKPNGSGFAPQVEISSPTKKRRLEEEGLILMDSKDDKLDDDVIEIDD